MTTTVLSMVRQRFIGYDADAVPEGGFVVVSSVAVFVQAAWLEPAGFAYHEVAKLQRGVTSAGDSGSDEEREDGDAGEAAKKKESASVDAGAWESSRKGKKGKDGKGEKKEQDHYALLGLGHLRYLATEDQIRKAYR